MSQSDIQALETQISQAKELIAQADMARKLSENFEFRKLFVEGYFRDEAARLVQLSDDSALTKDQQKEALRMAKATGHCRRYLSMMIQMAEHARGSLPDAEAELDELRMLNRDED